MVAAFIAAGPEAAQKLFKMTNLVENIFECTVINNEKYAAHFDDKSMKIELMKIIVALVKIDNQEC